MLRQWQDAGDYLRIKVLELLFVKGWANRDVATLLKVSEQQVANYRFAAVKKLADQLKDAGLPANFSQRETCEMEKVKDRRRRVRANKDAAATSALLLENMIHEIL